MLESDLVAFKHRLRNEDDCGVDFADSGSEILQAPKKIDLLSIITAFSCCLHGFSRYNESVPNLYLEGKAVALSIFSIASNCVHIECCRD